MLWSESPHVYASLKVSHAIKGKGVPKTQFNNKTYNELAEMPEIWNKEHPEDQVEVPVAD